jgi:hypothetical protein
VSGLVAKVMHHEECDSFVIGIVDSACEMLRCKFSCDFSFFPFVPLLSCDTLCNLRYLFGFCC